MTWRATSARLYLLGPGGGGGGGVRGGLDSGGCIGLGGGGGAGVGGFHGTGAAAL